MTNGYVIVTYKVFYVFLLFGFSCFGRAIASAPDAWFDVVERYSNDNNKTLKYNPLFIFQTYNYVLLFFYFFL